MPTTILEKLKNEPAVLVATVLAFVAYFGVRLSEDQVSTVSQLVTVLGPLIAGFITRQFVSPVASFGGLEDIETEGHPGNPLG